MSERNTIAALLNPSSATTDTTAPGTVTYDVASGKNATDVQLGTDPTPDALITVDGHQVAAGDNGLSLDIAPDGSTHVIHGPQNPAQPVGGAPTTVPTRYGQAPTTVPGQSQDGTQSLADGGGSPLGGQINQSGFTTQDGTQSADGTTQPVDGSGGGSATTGQYDQAALTQDPSHDNTPVEHLKGIGDHAAQADIALHGPNSDLPAPVIKTNADGSQDITIPKGPDNPQAVTVHVQPNKDGSLDLTVPKSDTNPHEIKIHVQPDKHVDLNITQDKDGHLKIDAHDHPPDQQGDWSGLKGPAGQGTNPADPAGAENPADGGVPVPDIPQQPDVPAAPSGGGGSGGLPSGSGGGDPTTTGVPKTDGSPIKTPQQSGVLPDGTLDVDSAAIKKRGSDLVHGPVKTLDTAVGHARDINIGYPGLGLLGSPIQMIHGSLTDSAAMELEQGSTTLSSSAQTMAQTGQIYGNAENQSTTAVQNTDKTGG
jgi:hypothetical protein